MTKVTEIKYEVILKLEPRTDCSSLEMVQSLLDQLWPKLPEAFTEGKIDSEVLRHLLCDDAEEQPERYSFKWHGKAWSRGFTKEKHTCG